MQDWNLESSLLTNCLNSKYWMQGQVEDSVANCHLEWSEELQFHRHQFAQNKEDQVLWNFVFDGEFDSDHLAQH